MSDEDKTTPREAGPERKRPRLLEVFRSYRLLRYVKPYKKLLALMFAIILVLAGCNFLQVFLVRELLKDGLWLPPEPPLAVTIDDIVATKLPEGLRAEARQIIALRFAEALNASKLTPKEKKKLEASEIEKAEQRIKSKIEKDEKRAGQGWAKLHPVVVELLAPLGERAVAGATRRLYQQLGQTILAELTPKLSEREQVQFAEASETAFAPPPESQPDMRYIGKLCLALLGVAVVFGLLVYTRSVLKAIIISRATFDIRSDLCDHLLDLDMRFFSNRSSGDMISRQTNDIVAGTKALTDLFEDMIPQPFEALAFAGAAFWVSWKLALAFCVLLIFLPFPVLKIARRVKKYGRQKLERIAELTTIMSEIFQGMRVTKAFHIEDRKHEEFREANDRYVSRLLKTMKLRGLNSAFTESFINVSIAVVMFLAAILVTTGLLGLRLDPPDVLTFAGCMLMLYRPIKTFTKAYPDFMESVVASERVFEILDIRPEVKEDPAAVALPPVSKSLTFRDVSFAYDTVPVLEHINIEVRRGQVVAVVGQSGAGKSTLLDLIPRFYDPDEGRVEIDEVDIRRATLASLRGQIAVVSQDPFLFQTTVLENIRYGRLDATDEEVYAAAQAANIHEFVDSLPEKYDTLCGERGVKLSGGQRQRITIARAILKDAPILILDEATSSLDTESERLVRDALTRLMEHRTTFVIAHRLSTVQHADRIIVLREGRLVETGTHAELIGAKGEYWRLYNTEFENSVPDP